MSAEKRSLTDFEDFPGEINEDKRLYEFPKLYKKDSKGNWSQWQVFVRLIKSKDKKTNKTNWDLDDDIPIPIKKKYIKGKPIPDNVDVQVWVEYGRVDGKITRGAPTYSEAKNIGRANERTALQTGLIDARSRFLKQKKRGYRETKNEELDDKLKCHARWYPMLLHKFEKYKKKIKYPCYLQEKLDGQRCLAFLNLKNKKIDDVTIDDVVLYSRTQHNWKGHSYIKEELLPILINMYDEKDNCSLYLDGELYRQNTPLQDIASFSKNEQINDKAGPNANQYWIYDCFYPTKLDLGYEDRLELLDDAFQDYPDDHEDNNKYWVKYLEVEIAKSEKEVYDLLEKHIKLGHEGVVVKNVNMKYLTSYTHTGDFLRSKEALKLKKRIREEYPVVDFTHGSRGDAKKRIIWILETEKGDKFKATPNVPHEEAEKLLKKANKKFDKKFKDRMMTIEFESKSKKGIPLKPKAIGFRDTTI